MWAVEKPNLTITNYNVMYMWFWCFCLDYWSESDQDEVDGSMTLKQEATYHHNHSVSINSRLSAHCIHSAQNTLFHFL